MHGTRIFTINLHFTTKTDLLQSFMKIINNLTLDSKEYAIFLLYDNSFNTGKIVFQTINNICKTFCCFSDLVTSSFGDTTGLGCKSDLCFARCNNT